MAERPAVRTAKVYLLSGPVSAEELGRIKRYLINPVESREAALEERATLAENYPEPPDVAVLRGFTSLDRAGLEALVADMGLAMDADDAECCREYFRAEGRDPSLTELRVLDTYWSDHCRHTTFGTDHRLRRHRRPDACAAHMSAASNCARELGRGRQAPHAHGAGHPWRPIPQKDGQAPKPRRVRGDKRLLRARNGGRGRARGAMAAHVQERDAQPPDGNRALRRRGDLHRRGHP
ncbi:MAG: hypothetical protein ACLTSG_03590 [Lachnospiraceae bacterium]